MLSNVTAIRLKLETLRETNKEIDEVIHPLAAVISQDCDLDLDYKARYGAGAAHRLIENVLVCAVDDADAMRARGGLNSKQWADVTTYQNERYHVLPPVPPEIAQLGERFARMLGLDFRRFFTIPCDELYRRIEIGEAVRHCYLESPYRDHLSNRFYWYHMRVALP